MRKVVYSLIGLMLFAGTSLADVKQGNVQVTLSVPQVVSLTMITTAVVVVPGPEDYARNLEDGHLKLYGCLTGTEINDKFKGKGFADRAEAIRMIIFTNAQSGATVYVHGIQPEQAQGILRLEDTFLTVMTEKTWVLLNGQEGANAKWTTGGPTDGYRTIPDTGKAHFLQMVNEAQKIFGVECSTKAPREVALKLGIGNLDRYTEGNYTNTLVFTLMPRV